MSGSAVGRGARMASCRCALPPGGFLLCRADRACPRGAAWCFCPSRRRRPRKQTRRLALPDRDLATRILDPRSCGRSCASRWPPARDIHPSWFLRENDKIEQEATTIPAESFFHVFLRFLCSFLFLFFFFVLFVPLW